MKTLLITFLCLAGLFCSIPASSQKPDELKRISMMIVQAKSKDEILKKWESVVKRYPKMDVDKVISTILTNAKQENEKNKSSQSYNTAVSLTANLQKQMHDNAIKIIDNMK